MLNVFSKFICFEWEAAPPPVGSPDYVVTWESELSKCASNQEQGG